MLLWSISLGHFSSEEDRQKLQTRQVEEAEMVEQELARIRANLAVIQGKLTN